MKKTISPGNRARRFIALVVCLAAWLLPHKSSAQTGLSCSAAYITPAHGGTVSITTSSLDTWYSIVVDSNVVQIDVYNTDTGATAISDMHLYSGSCTGLTLLNGIRSNSDHLTGVYSGLTRTSTYYLKLTKANTTSTSCGFAVVNLSTAVLASCSWGCPANPNNTWINTCQAVCNGGFESYSTAPYNISCISLACPWDTSGLGYKSTPDLFNTTVATYQGPYVKVPANLFGAQTPHHGNGYAGIITYDNTHSNYREFLVEPLTVPMVAGKKYRVSYWVNLGGHCGYKTSGMGVFLSATNPNLLGFNSLKNQNPQVKGALYNTAISDTTNWVLITDTITPTVTMNYIAIGCFKTDALNNHTTVPHTLAPWHGYGQPGANVGSFAYYYVDDVSIVPEGAITVTASPNPACNGIPVTLIATSTIGNGYYNWSTTNSAGVTCHHSPYCDTITSVLPQSYSATYTATTYLPSFGNCTISDSIHPSWLAGPVNVNAGWDQSICLGGSASITGTSGGTYTTSSWANINGNAVCSGCTTASVSPTSTSQYVFTATNTQTGCSQRDTIKITVVPLAPVIVSQAGANTCSGCYNFSTALPYSNYSWGSNALSSNCTTCATFNACYGPAFSPPTAPVSVTVTNSSGCSGSAVIYVPICCHNDKDTMHALIVNDSSSHLGLTQPGYFFYNNANQYYEVQNKFFAINGILYIDKNTRLIGCEVKLGPNARIVVRPGVKFELTNYNATTFTRLHSCTDMWDGIYVDGTNPNSKVSVLNGTIIEDAKNAIVSSHGGNFLIDGTNYTVKLNKNNIGVLVHSYTGTHLGTIRKAIISCDSPVQTGGTPGFTYPGATCRAPVNAVSFAGVVIDTCTNVTIGDTTAIGYRNLFERTQIGVYSLLSTAKVQNNDFKYFTTSTLSKTAPSNGIAVWATNKLSNTNRTLTVGQIGTKKANNYFLKCTYGVMASDYMSLSCQYNRLDSCSGVGIYALQDGNRTILINRDSLVECTGTNISCVNVNNSTVTITNNMINQSQNLNASNFGQTGIYVANAVNTAHVNLSIQNNSVKKMQNGIWVSYVNGGKIFSNTVNILSGQNYTVANPGTGIRIEKGYNNHVRQNTLAFSTTPQASQYDKLFGIFIYDCKADTVTKNTITNMGSGIYMKTANNPCVIACNTMNTCPIGINFGYTNNTVAGVSVNSQLNWGNTTATATGNIWNNCGSSLTGKITGTANGIYWYYSTNPAANYLPNNPQMTIFSLANNIPASLGNVNDQCNYMLLPPIQTEPNRRDFILAGICKTPRTYDTLNTEFTYDDKVFAYRTLLDNPSWLAMGTTDDSYYSSFFTAQSATNIGKLAKVENEIAAGNFTAAASDLAAITPTNEQETNYKTVMGVYLNSWALDSMNLTSAQADLLRPIAHQGALHGGTAVFDARTMLNEEEHDSSNVRLLNPAASELQQGATVSHIYPNPSTGQVSIGVELPEGQIATLELFDLAGRKVAGWQLVSGQSVYTFDCAFLPAGTYIYRVTSGEAVLRTDRLIIMKQD